MTNTYDANGDETGSSAGLALVYNNAVQTTSVTPVGGSPTAMSYRGTGQTNRATSGATSFVSNILGLASETTSGQTTSYVRDPSGTLIDERTASGSRFYYLYDGLGSVVGLTNSTGTLVNSYTYDPYGNMISSTEGTPNHWKFAGGYLDATGLYKFGQRYYDPVTGRWTQPDPLGAMSDPSSSSVYCYAGDDPVGATDPTGLMQVGGGAGGHWMATWHASWHASWHPTWRPDQEQHPLPQSLRWQSRIFQQNHPSGTAGAATSSAWGQVGHFLYSAYKAGQEAWNAAGKVIREQSKGWLNACYQAECWLGP